jgi:hypothetical protein
MSKFDLNDVLALEGEQEVSEQEYFQALQRAINEGQWSLQGSYGRTMMEAIQNGFCMLGEQPAKDYWGNRIPSRHEVLAGTKGSRQFVAAQCGEEWAAAIEGA